MAYQNQKETQASGKDENLLPEKQHVREQRSFALPNSLMMALPMTPPPGTPNSVMREMLEPQIPDAEAEADRLSAGIRFGTPDSVRREMGRRLGSDFSSVRFHTGPQSVFMNDHMGSRAYTRGSDVFFGRGGFDPSVGAHELVHTVQQGAVSGHVSLSVPFGTIQRWLWNDDDDDDDDDVLAPLRDKRPGVLDTLKEKGKSFLSHFKKSRNNGEDPEEDRDEEGGGRAAAPAARNVPGGGGAAAAPAARNVPGGGRAAPPAARNAPGGGRAQVQNPIQQPESFSTRISKLYSKKSRIQLLRDDAKYQKRLQNIPNQVSVLDRRSNRVQQQDPQMYQQMRQQKDGLEALKTRIDHQDLEQIKTRIERLDNMVTGDARKAAPTDQRVVRPLSKLERDLTQMERDWDDLLILEPDHVLPNLSQQPQQAGGAANNPPAGITQQEINDTFRIENGEAKTRHRYGSSYEMDPGKIEKLAAQYRHDYWQQHFVDEGGNEKQPQNISGPINYGLRQAAAAAGGAAPAAGNAPIGGQPQAPAPAPAAGNAPIGGQPQAPAPAPAAGNAPIAGQPAPAPDPGRHMRRAKDASAYMNLARNTGVFVNNLGKTIYLGSEWQHTTKSSLKLPNNTYGKWVNPIGSGLMDVAGLGAGAASTVTSAIDFGKNINNFGKGTSATDVFLSGMDTISQAGKTAGSAWSMVNNFGNAGSNVPILSFGGAAKGVPIISAVTGSIDALTGSVEGVRGMYQSRKISNQIKKLEGAEPDPNLAATPAVPGGKTDQQKLLEIAKQGRSVTRINAASGWMKAGAGALSAASGITAATGVGAPVGLGLSMLSAFLSGVRFAFNLIAKHNLRKKVLGDEFGIDWSTEMDDVQKMVRRYNPNMSLNRDERKQVLLKAHGSDQTDIKKAFQETNLKRARYLLSLADPANNSDFRDVATEVIKAMGIKPRNGRFAAGAEELLAKKLT